MAFYDSMSARLMGIDARQYGVRGDGSSLDYQYLQAAIDAADAMSDVANQLGMTVLLPPGRFRVNAPLRIRQPCTRIVGSGRHVSTIYNPYGNADGLLIGPEMSGFPKHGAAFVPAPGSYSLDFPVNDNSFVYIISELPSLMWYVHSVNRFCARFYIKPHIINGSGGHIASSRGKRTASASVESAWGVTLANGRLRANITTTSGVFTITDPASLVANTRYHVQADWDGTTFRLFKDGVVVASTAVGGALIQKWYEDTFLGSGYIDFDASNLQTNGPEALLEDFQFGAHSYNSSNFTPPNYMGADGICKFNTRMHHAVDAVDGYEVVFDDNGSAMYMPIRFIDYAPMTNCQVESLGFSGCHTGIRVHLTPRTSIRHIRVANGLVSGVYLGNNSYFSEVHDIDATIGGITKGRFGVGLGVACGVTNVSECKVSGARVGYYAFASGVEWRGNSYDGNATSRRGIWDKQSYGSTAGHSIDGFIVGNESGLGLEHCVVLEGGGGSGMVQGLQTAVTGPISEFLLDAEASPGGSPLVVMAPTLRRDDYAQARIELVNGAGPNNWADGRVTVFAPGTLPSDVAAWCDTAGKVVVYRDGAWT